MNSVSRHQTTQVASSSGQNYSFRVASKTSWCPFHGSAARGTMVASMARVVFCFIFFLSLTLFSC